MLINLTYIQKKIIKILNKYIFDVLVCGCAHTENYPILHQKKKNSNMVQAKN